MLLHKSILMKKNLFLLSIYDKSEKDDLTNEELFELLNEIE